MASRDANSSINFRDPAFLKSHAASILNWYARDECLAPEGGLFHGYKDDGTVYDAHTRHLVSSTRFIVEFAWAVKRVPEQADLWRARLDNCLKFLRTAHKSHLVPGAYKWVIDAPGGGAPPRVVNAANKAYGLSFVLLAYASALAAGVTEARGWVDETWDTLTTRFWQEQYGLYADEADAEFHETLAYKGQNANMHACESHLAAWDATHDYRHLERARIIAHSLCVRQASRVKSATGFELVYEHYMSDWSAPDLEHNRENPKDMFQPWGFQPGHLLEWTKLLMQLHERRDAVPNAPETPEQYAWRPIVAARFFQVSCTRGWDFTPCAASAAEPEGVVGGFAYCISPLDLSVCDNDKYFWPCTEGIAAAALLALHTPATNNSTTTTTNGGGSAEGSSSSSTTSAIGGGGTSSSSSSGGGSDGHWTRDTYLQWYDRIWSYCWAHFVDHEHEPKGGGAWFRILAPDNSKMEDTKSPPGKTDYHTIGACLDAETVMLKLRAEAGHSKAV